MFKVLLVEDDQAVRLIIKKQLLQEGLEVVAASTGEEADLLASKQHDFDVAILDYVLPGKLEGLSLVRALRKSCPGIGVIQMSGHPFNARNYKEDHGYDVFLTKPVRRHDLIEAVNYAYQAHSILRRSVSE